MANQQRNIVQHVRVVEGEDGRKMSFTTYGKADEKRPYPTGGRDKMRSVASGSARASAQSTNLKKD